MTKPERRSPIGGVIHTYQKYNPTEFPSPTAEPPDMVSGAFEHALAYGKYRQLTEEELARAIQIDPSQIGGLGPSIDMLMEMLEDRKRKILETYQTDGLEKKANDRFEKLSKKANPPAKLKGDFHKAVHSKQIYLLEQVWYRSDRESPDFAAMVLHVMEALGDKYNIDDLVSKYTFTGHERMDIPKALEIKKELEKIDELLEQLKEAAKTAQIGLIDMDALAEFAPPSDLNQLEELREQISNYVREMAERQGLDRDEKGAFHLTPKAHKTFQSRLLSRIFSQLKAGRSGRHEGRIVGDGSVELPSTKQYEFGDSIANLDTTQSVINAMLKRPDEFPVRMRSDDLEVHRTKNTPKCATVVIMDMSGSMRYDGQYMNVKRMGLALQGLITSEYPGDFLRFIEMYSFAKLRRPGEIIDLMPKPVTIHNPVVNLKADMSDENMSEHQVPPHFTNIQHALRLARQNLATADSPNKQIVLITDGLPTAHFEGEMLYLMYPPNPRTEKETMREAMQCAKEGIVINMFLVPSWSQSEEDIRFAYRLAEQTKGRVFFTAGNDLDRFVLWDYVDRKREIL
ncbi:MAG: VWA domain-containing protein [Planctomycetota bacterium]|nr:VWA domain-containing protein [Planctomycetota bacterium]